MKNICLPLLDIYEMSQSRFTYKLQLLANFSSCSLNERSLPSFRTKSCQRLLCTRHRDW